MNLSEKTIKKLKENVFVSGLEEVKAVLGNSHLENLLANKTIRQAIIVVSDKKVYFKGNSYKLMGKHFEKQYEEKTVDLKDVTGTSFYSVKILGFLIAGIFLSIFTLGYMFVNFLDSGLDYFGDYSQHLVVSCILLFITYFFSGRTIFEVAFAGGSICLGADWYSEEEIQEFEKELRRAKDNISESKETEKIGEGESVSKTNKLDRLKELKELLDGGIIDEGEFEELKKEIITSNYTEKC